jgi:hypothetical protein
MACSSDAISDIDQVDTPRMKNIAAHLRHVYSDLVEEDVPDRFAVLLARLRAKDDEEGTTDET